MADQNNKAIYGKKVFFLYPNYNFQSAIIDRLRTMEYEVYTINDYHNVKNILTKNRDSIFFVNPDSIFNADSWAYFIETIESDERYEGISVGLCTEKLTREEIKNFESKLKLTAGIIETKDTEEALREVVKSLDKNEAKGMRQYVRANCLSDASAEMFWVTANNMMYKMKIIDISSVGTAVRIPAKQVSAIQLNQIMKNVNLMLRGHKLNVVVKAIAVKADGPNYIAVLMFEMETAKNVLNTIRSYVAETLMRKIEDDIFGMPADQTDYVIKPSRKKKEEESKN